MPRKFVDYISPETNSNLRAMLEMSMHLGYSQIWLGRHYDSKSFDIGTLPRDYPLKLITRLDINASEISKEKIIQILRRERRNFPIIAIKCSNAELASWAAQDNRIDILSFPLNQLGKLYTRSVAKLMVKFVKYLEISLGDLYLSPERVQIPTFRKIQQALEIAQLKSVPIIVNSGATTRNQIRAPWDLASLSQILLSRKVIPLDSISSIPIELLHRNQVKVSNDYLAPGIFKAPNSHISTLEEE